MLYSRGLPKRLAVTNVVKVTVQGWYQKTSKCVSFNTAFYFILPMSQAGIHADKTGDGINPNDSKLS